MLRRLSMITPLSLWSILLALLLSCNFDVTNSQNIYPTKKPNLLFILDDQHRFDTINFVQNELERYVGKTKVNTPNLNKLLQNGAYFRNAYCQSAVTGPSQTSMRSGCTAERTGVQSNLLIEPEYYTKSNHFKRKIKSLETFDQILVEEYGYTSEYYGKFHIPERLYYKRNGNESERVIKYNDYDYDTGKFIFKTGTSGGDRTNKYLKSFADKGLIPTANQIIKKEKSVDLQKDPYTDYPYTPIQLDSRFGYPSNTPLKDDEGFSEDEISQGNVMGRYSLPVQYTPTYFEGEIGGMALDRLAQKNNPFLLTVSFHSPHSPFVPASRYLDKYWKNRSDIFVPPSINATLANTAYYDVCRKKSEFRLEQGYSDEIKLKEWIALYYALVEEIDAEIGKMMSTLDKYGIANNTMIIFTSDHGEMLGDLGTRGKSVFFEGSSRIPLLISFPDQIPKETVVDVPVSQIDLFSTVIDYLGASQSDNSDGKSLRRYIENKSYNEEYDDTFIVAEGDFRTPTGEDTLNRQLDSKPSLMVVKGHYKLMMVKDSKSDKVDMLYDLSNDPYEVNNLLGRNSMKASDILIGKAEHLRCLLLEWMERMDGDDSQKYFSSSKYNAYEGRGDITEIRKRQEWKRMNIWVGDAILNFGAEVWNESSYVRNEYLYIGRTTSGFLQIVRISIEGQDASLFRLDQNYTNLIIKSRDHLRIQVKYNNVNKRVSPEFVDASVRIVHSDGDDIKIPITLASNMDNVVTQIPASTPMTVKPTASPTPILTTPSPAITTTLPSSTALISKSQVPTIASTTTKPPTETLASGVIMIQNDPILSEQYRNIQNLGVFWELMANGNLILSRGSKEEPREVLWSTGTKESIGAYFTKIQNDGNFVTYAGTPDERKGAVWKSRTGGNSGPFQLYLDLHKMKVSLLDGNNNEIWFDPIRPTISSPASRYLRRRD